MSLSSSENTPSATPDQSSSTVSTRPGLEVLETEIIREEAAWHEMRDSWNDLLDDSVYPNIFSRWEWQTLWWKHFIRNGELFIILVRSGRELVGLLPLYVRRHRIPLLGVFRELTPIGIGAMVCPEYLGPIIRKGCIESVTRALCDSLLDSGGDWDSILLDEVACDDPGTMAFAGELSKRFRTVETPGEPRWYIDLPASYEEYLAGLSSRNRKQKKRRLNQAQRLHSVNVTLPTADSIEVWFPRIVHLSCSSRAKMRQNMPFLNPQYASFHRDVLQALLPLCMTTVLFVNYGDAPVAFSLSYAYNEKCYAFQTGMDVGAPGSPGILATQFTIMEMINRRMEEFDFLRGDEDYKATFANRLRDTRTLRCFHPKRHVLFQMRRSEAKLRRIRCRIGRMIR